MSETDKIKIDLSESSRKHKPHVIVIEEKKMIYAYDCAELPSNKGWDELCKARWLLEEALKQINQDINTLALTEMVYKKDLNNKTA